MVDCKMLEKWYRQSVVNKNFIFIFSIRLLTTNNFIWFETNSYILLLIKLVRHFSTLFCFILMYPMQQSLRLYYSCIFVHWKFIWGYNHRNLVRKMKLSEDIRDSYCPIRNNFQVESEKKKNLQFNELATYDVVIEEVIFWIIAWFGWIAKNSPNSCSPRGNTLDMQCCVQHRVWKLSCL